MNDSVWESARAELQENIGYCREHNIPVCTINFNVYLERMEGFTQFLREVRAYHPEMSWHVTTYYDNFNHEGDRIAGHFMYYNITVSVPLL